MAPTFHLLTRPAHSLATRRSQWKSTRARLQGTGQAEKVWQPDDLAALLRVAGPGIQAATMLAVWTEQRPGDLLAPLWSGHDGSTIRLVQSTGSKPVLIPVAPTLKVFLDGMKAFSRSC